MSAGALSPEFVVQAALQLPLADRVEVLQQLWDSLPADSGGTLLSPELNDELDRRIAFEEAHPDDELTWDEVQANVPRQR